MAKLGRPRAKDRDMTTNRADGALQITATCPKAIIEALDAYCAEIAKTTGTPMARSAAVRGILTLWASKRK